MKSDHKHIQYTAEDIRAYLEGKLSPYEQHTLEKAALDDPFLAEAIEGYEGMAGKEWQSPLADLKNDFSKKNEPAKVIPMHGSSRKTGWRVAAGLLLLILGAGAVYLFTKQPVSEKQPTLAKTETVPVDAGKNVPVTTQQEVITTPADHTTTKEKKVIASVTPGKTSTTTVAPSPYTINSTVTTVKAQQQPVRADKHKSDSAYYDLTVLDRNTTTAGIITPAPSVHPENEAVVFAKKEQDRIARERKQTDGVGYNNNQQLPVRNFFAQVVAPDNTPLPFANISVRSGNFDTYADAKGNVRLVSPDSLLTVEVKSLGYQSRYYTMRSNQPQNKITLVEDKTALKEMTVVKAKNSGRFVSRRAMLMRDSIMNVEPADGWDNYNTYIANNIDIPDDIIKNNLHGEVEVSFDVKPNGSITNIKVDKSLCDNCDEAVKRIIEQGPQWKVRKGRTQVGS